MNEGLHHHAEPALEIQRIAKLAHAFRPIAADRPPNFFQVARARDRVRFFWRELSPQHFEGTPNGSYAVHGASTYDKNKTHRSCVPLAEGTARGPLLRWTLDTMRTLARLPVIKVWNATASQHDSHLERRTAYTKVRKSVDCTHFCEPSAVMEAWVDATAATLQGAAREAPPEMDQGSLIKEPAVWATA